MIIAVSSAARPHRLVTAIRAFVRAYRSPSAAMPGRAGTTAPMGSHDGQPPSAQDQSLAQLRALYRQRHHLLVEKEILVVERARAVRQRKRVSDFDARLRAINRELLSIG